MRTMLIQFRNAIQTTCTLVTENVLPNGGSWNATSRMHPCLFGPLQAVRRRAAGSTLASARPGHGDPNGMGCSSHAARRQVTCRSDKSATR